MATLSFDIPNRIAEVAAPDSTITIQEIYDQFRDFEDEMDVLFLPTTIQAGGKDPLPGGAQTVITCTLLDGWRIRFEARGGPTTEQMTITGGNLVGQDALGGEQFPVAPSAFTHVTIAQATTGALLGTLVPEYQGGVWIDTINGQSGTSFPTGTPGTPVDNMADALTIAQSLGIFVFKLLSNVTVTQDVSTYRFEAVTGGQGVTFSGATTTNTFVQAGFIGGAINGAMFVKETEILNGVTGLSGTFLDSRLSGTITVAGDCTFIHCVSGVAGVNPAVVSLSGAGGALSIEFRNYTGGLSLTNSTLAHNISVDLDPGILHIDGTNTAGTLKLRGIGEPVNDTGASFATVDDDGFLVASDSTKLRKVMMNRFETDPVSGVLTVYEDDDATTFASGNIYEDVAGTQPYQGQGIERRNRLT